jgi:hypothetical protein
LKRSADEFGKGSGRLSADAITNRRFNFPVHSLSAASPARERPRGAFESRVIWGGAD